MITLRNMSRPLHERSYLGHFIGWPRPPHASKGFQNCTDEHCDLNVRSVLLAEYSNREDMHVTVDVPYSESFLGLVSSVFCFVPRGKSAWSSRFFQTFFASCIPIILNDEYEPPFGEFMHMPSFMIKWPMTQARPSMLGKYLQRLYEEQPATVEQMRIAGSAARCWYSYPPSYIEWDWIELNRSKFNQTCATWHINNAFVAISKLLAIKATSAQHRFFWIDTKGKPVHGIADDTSRQVTTKSLEV